ncbi:MAG TPA: CpsB/CapC family capsule biosynthesis tyrosine phosphatase [Terriglobales bacterium]|nr:CpsB/CapC family capsule biosynthesis tyrosine phosphatase [Terriglobales bacterium]
MVDIHCHLLPHVDDGAESWEIAVGMCRMAQQDGIRHIVATPHANDEFSYDRAAHAALLQQLRERVAGSVRLSLGCDFHFSYENIQDAMANPERYTIEDTPYLLVELSDFAVPPGISDSLLRFLSIGISPIITHPERNPILQRTPERILKWVDLGCAVQVTASAFTGRWGKKARQVAEMLLKRHAVHVLASDAHDLEDRQPILSAARDIVARLSSAETAAMLVEQNPQAIVNGEDLLWGSR